MATLAHPAFRRHLGRRGRIFVAAAGLVLAIVAVMAIIVRGRDAERTAIARMAPDQRRELFTQTLRSTEALCAEASRDAALSGRCIDAARFLLVFPECDDACVTFVRAHQLSATR